MNKVKWMARIRKIVAITAVCAMLAAVGCNADAGIMPCEEAIREIVCL